MTDNTLRQIPQKKEKVFESGGSSNDNNNNIDSDSMIYKNDGSGQIHGSAVEKTLDNLLNEANNHFPKAESLIYNTHQQVEYHNNNNVSDTDTNNIKQPVDAVSDNKNIPADFETVIENAIISMDSNQTLINEKKELNNDFTKNIHNNEEKSFILESMLSEDHNPTISFELDDLVFPATTNHDFSNDNCVSNSNITTTEAITTTKNNNGYNDNDLKRKIGDINIDFEEFEKLTKSAKISINDSHEPPFLSPASLSPMSSLSMDNNESKITEQDNSSNKDILNKSNEATILHKVIENNNNSNIHKKNVDNNLINKTSNDLSKTNSKIQNTSKSYSYTSNRNMLISRTNSTYNSQSYIPEKLTKEYTMHQISEMKKRIINTHKLLLNFNFLKDSYAKTCIELKKSLNALRDSEIHRAHLLLENEQLKTKLLKLESSKSE